jgi:plastocyanin
MVLLAVLALAAPARAADDTTINITAAKFDPRSVTVTVGDFVSWHNADLDAHSVIADNGAFDSTAGCTSADPNDCLIQPGDDWAPDDTLPVGDYTYHDGVDPTVTAVLHVAPVATTTTTARPTTTTTRPTTTSSSTTTTLATTTSSTTSTTLATSSTSVPDTSQTAAGKGNGGGGSGWTFILVGLIVVVVAGIIAVSTYMYRNREAPDFDDIPR